MSGLRRHIFWPVPHSLSNIQDPFPRRRASKVDTKLISAARMVLLVSLPPETLQGILHFLGGKGLVCLWCTGSSSLRRTISTRGALNSVSLSLPYLCMDSSRLPGMLRSCTLITSLTIEASSIRIARSRRIWDVLSKLVLLKTLKLSCEEAEEWLFEEHEYDANLDSFFDLPEEATAQTVSSTPSPNFRPIDTTFSRLEELYLSTRRHYLKPEHLAFFPKSLTSIIFESNDSFDSSALPYLFDYPNIRTFKLFSHEYSQLSGVLPPTITSLSIEGTLKPIPLEFWGDCKLISLEAYIDEQSFQSLPKTLERIRISISRSDSFIYQNLSHLANLRHVHLVGSVSSPTTHDPPSTLSPLLETFTSDGYVNLPENVPPVSWFRNPSIMMREITLRSLVSASVILLLKVARKMKNLSSLILECSELVCSPMYLSDLPESLKNFTLRLRSWMAPPNANGAENIHSILSQLPQGLTLLNLEETRFYMTSKASAMLPRQLKTLQIAYLFESLPGDDSFIEAHLLALPRTLTSMTLTHISILENSSSVSLGSATKTSPRERSPHDTKWTSSMVRNLPVASLSYLKVVGCLGTVWTLESMKAFGTNILYLTLESGQMGPEALENLPSNLLRFTAKEASHHLTGEGFKRLPKSLTILELPTADFQEQDLSHLPKTLTYLNLTTWPSHITPESAKFLPRSVAHVHPSSCPIGMGLVSLRSELRNNTLRDPDYRTGWL